jgi:hypothetical protein
MDCLFNEEPLFSIPFSALDDNKSNIKDKLLKLITRRPTIEELEKQGIIKGWYYT